MKKVKELRITNWQSSHGAVKYSFGDIVNDIVVTMYSAKWVLEILGDHFVKYMIV